jgi:hypothetical protein
MSDSKFNPIINYIISISKKYTEYEDNLYNSINDTKLVKKEMSKFHKKNKILIEKYLDKEQNKKASNNILGKSINKKLRQKILNNINKFSSKIPIDYHPGSNNKVLNIVHPSLYPYINKKPSKKK